MTACCLLVSSDDDDDDDDDDCPSESIPGDSVEFQFGLQMAAEDTVKSLLEA